MRVSVTAWAPWCVGMGASVLWSVAQPGNTPSWCNAVVHAAIVAGAFQAGLVHKDKHAEKDASKVRSNTRLTVLLQILKRQVQAGIDKSETAVMEIVSTLGQIQRISAALHSEASAAIEHSNTISAGLQRLTAESQQTLQMLEEQQHALAMRQAHKEAQVSQAMKDVANLSPLVEMVGSIAKQTHLLSFNAATEAARAGDAGSGFKIVATEVRALAQQTTEAAQHIKDGIAKVQTTVEGHTVRYATELHETLGSVDAIRSLLTRNVEHSAALGPFLLQLSQSMDQGTAIIRDQVVDTLGQMQFQDILRQLLEQVEHGLQALAEYSDTSVHGGAQPQVELETLMQQWQSRYVMLEQRIAHSTHAIDSSASAGVGPKIELF